MVARWLCLVLAVAILVPFCAGACPVECCPDTHQDADHHHGDEGACDDCFCLKVAERPDTQVLPDLSFRSVPTLTVPAAPAVPEVAVPVPLDGSPPRRYLAPFLLRHAFLF